MARRVAGRSALGTLFCMGLASCSPYGWEQRYGLAPILDAGAVEISSANQRRILSALANDAGVDLRTSSNWYLVAEAGFDYIDDQCRSYFDHLFFLDRDRERIKSGLAAAGQTTSAIMAVTGASTVGLAIVAQAFGFGVTATELVAGSYLYRLPPATTYSFVKELQIAFREGAAQRRTQIGNRSEAYHYIQGYLDLCLPPTIEAKIVEHIGSARAFPDPVSAAPESFGINVTSKPSTVRPQSNELIRRAGEPLPPVDKPTSAVPSKNRFTPTEAALSDREIRKIQGMVCVKADGDLGPHGSATRQAIRLYVAARTRAALADIPDTISPRVRAQLDEALDSNVTCVGSKFKNAYEVGRYGIPSQQTRPKLLEVQQGLKKLLEGTGVSVPDTGDLDISTRQAIARARERLKLEPPTDQIDPQLDDAIRRAVAQ